MILHFLISAIKRPHGRFEGKFLKKKKLINMLIFFTQKYEHQRYKSISGPDS